MRRNADFFAALFGGLLKNHHRVVRNRVHECARVDRMSRRAVHARLGLGTRGARAGGSFFDNFEIAGKATERTHEVRSVVTVPSPPIPSAALLKHWVNGRRASGRIEPNQSQRKTWLACGK